MHCLSLHPWNVSTQQAVEIQRSLASRVSAEDGLVGPPRYVAGVDISPPDAHGIAVGAAVLLELPQLQIVEVQVFQGNPGFPYVPGLLSFREAPLLLGALERLVATPNLILVDGQGLAHPRRFGLACHLGLLANTPTIGCAKSILCGRPSEALAPRAGSRVPLVDRGEVVGAAVRTRDSVSPIYVSIGHKVSLDSAVALTLACCKRYRIPEPTRLAHLAAAGRIAPREPGEHQNPQHASRDAAVHDKDGVN
ncbi:MAG: deoxyribonuclease V [Chloroflexi bacterium]|nr:deoxyribonuclease V [Chloroflexota bacterium]